MGLLGRAFGDGVGGVTLAGRGLALACLLWAAVNAGVAATGLTGSRRGGVLAGLCLLLWIGLLTPGRVGTNDPHFLSLAMGTLGICAVLRGLERQQAGWVEAAAGFFAAALFVKNSAVGFPIATVAFLLVNRRFRLFAVFAGVGMAVGVALLGLTLAVDGPFFLRHLLAPRAFDRATGLENLGTFAGAFFAPLAVGVAGLVWRGDGGSRYVLLCVAGSAALAAAFGFGDGVTYNIGYETLAVLAIGVAAGVDAAARGMAGLRRGWVAVAAVVLVATGSALVRAPAEAYGALGRAARLPAREAAFMGAAAAVRAVPGAALCESILLCLQAGKEFEYDPYFVTDQGRIGRVPDARAAALVAGGRFGVVQIGEDEATVALDGAARLRFSAGVMGALLGAYRVAEEGGGYAVLVPR